MPARCQTIRDSNFGRDIRQIYSMGECLGTGNYGTVRVCELRSNSPQEAHVIINATRQETVKRRTEDKKVLTSPIAGEKHACKTIPNAALVTKADALAVHTEIQATRMVDRHPNVVQLSDVHRDKEGMHLVMELMTGGDLYEELSRRGTFSESDASGVFRQLVVAVEYLHSKNIFHRDLKLENCLLTWPDQKPLGGIRAFEKVETKNTPGTSRISKFRKEGGVGMGSQPPTQEPLVKIADFGLCVLLKGENDRVVELAGEREGFIPVLIILFWVTGTLESNCALEIALVFRFRFFFETALPCSGPFLTSGMMSDMN